MVMQFLWQVNATNPLTCPLPHPHLLPLEIILENERAWRTKIFAMRRVRVIYNFTFGDRL